MNQLPKKILIIKPGAIGDLLHISPTVRALKKHFPAAEIDIMVSSRATVCLFANNPQTRKVLFFDRKGEHRSWGSFKTLWSAVRSENYDLVINFQRSTLKVWLLVLAAFPCRVLVYHKTKSRTVHAVTNHLETVAPLGIDPQEENPDLEFYPSSEDEIFAERFIAEAELGDKQLVALNLGASNRIKCWPPDSFAELTDRIQQVTGRAVLLVGGKDELDLAAQVMTSCTTKPFNLAGALSLGQLGALLKRCKVLVSGDTGPLHLATAVGTKVIALFGAIDPERTGPVGKGHVVISHPELECVPCNAKTCSHAPCLECMTLITAEEVMRALNQILAAH